MKRFVIALIMLCLAVAISVSAEVIFFKRTDALIDSMNELLRAIDAGDEEKMSTELKTVKENWNRSKKILHVILIHRSMDEIEININSLEEFLKSKDFESLRQSCTEGLQQLENLQDASRLSIENIL